MQRRTPFRSSFLVALLAGGLLLALTPPTLASTTYTFSGSVDASLSADRWDGHPFSVASPGEIVATVDWQNADADLELFLKDPSGSIVTHARTSSKPERLTYDATVAGTWRLGVRAASGKSWYTARVSIATTTAPSTKEALRPWIPDFFGTDHTRTRTEALADATSFDMIVANTRTYEEHAAAMHEANPELRLLAYYNGTFALLSEGPFPESWFLHDAQGKRLYNKAWPNLYLMDPSNPGWRDNRAKKCASLISSSGYDGCLLDNMGSAVLDRGYLSGLPIDPDTGKVYTEDKWYRDASGLMGAVKTHVSPKLVMANGLRSGSFYMRSASQLLASADGGMPEAFCRVAGAGISEYRPEDVWRQDVEMLVDAEAKEKSILAVTKVWRSGTQAQKDAWHEYCLGTFLLGSNGRSFFFFSDQHGDPVTVVHPWWKTDLGTPSSAYGKVGGVYQRSFTRGKVLVNPTSSTYTVSLGGTYVDLRGNKKTTVTLAPHTAEILREA